MRSNTVEFDFMPNDRVTMKNFNNMQGIVNSLNVDKAMQKQYLVEWMDSENDVVSRWFFGNELARA